MVFSFIYKPDRYIFELPNCLNIFIDNFCSKFEFILENYSKNRRNRIKMDNILNNRLNKVSCVFEETFK
jgi:hypothetical protein